MDYKIQDFPKFLKESPSEGFSERNPPPLGALTQILADGLRQVAVRKAFSFWESGKFRKLSNLAALEKVEQDRIFNELILSALVLTMMILEARDLRVDPDFKEHLKEAVKEAVGEAHLRELRELGLDRKNLRLWRKLVQMRYDEYTKSSFEIRTGALELESQERPLTSEKVMEVQALLPIHAVAIGTFSHISRGKGKPEDPLFRAIVRFCEQVYLDLRFTLLEGYRRPLWRKVWIKSKVFFSDLWERIRPPKLPRDGDPTGLDWGAVDNK